MQVAVVLAVFASGCALLAGPTQAQDVSDTRTDIRQNNTGNVDATGASQITSRTAGAPRPVTTQDRRVMTIPTPSRDQAPFVQVSDGRASAQIGAQVTTEASGAGPSPSGAALAQGRVTAVTRPRGPDRCDPQARAPLGAVCGRVIEARASDFVAPDPQPLSAEQRLLAAQRDLRPSMDLGAQTRRLAAGQIDESNSALAIASVALQQTGRAPDDKDPVADTSAIDAIVSSITSLVTGSPPTP